MTHSLTKHSLFWQKSLAFSVCSDCDYSNLWNTLNSRWRVGLRLQCTEAYNLIGFCSTPWIRSAFTTQINPFPHLCHHNISDVAKIFWFLTTKLFQIQLPGRGQCVPLQQWPLHAGEELISLSQQAPLWTTSETAAKTEKLLLYSRHDWSQC